MSSSLPIFPTYASGKVIDERLNGEKGRAQVFCLGHVVDDSDMPADDNEERGRSNKTTKSQRRTSSEDANTVTCTTPTKTCNINLKETSIKLAYNNYYSQ